MANSIISHFKGNEHPEIFIKDIFDKTKTLTSGMVSVQYNQNGSEFYLPSLSATLDLRENLACGWNPTTDITIGSRVVKMKDYDFQHTRCKRDFIQTFQAQLKGQHSARGASIWEQEINFVLYESYAKAIDQKIWTKTGTTASITDGGFLYQFTNDPDVNRIVGATAINKTNVVNELMKLDEAAISLYDSTYDVQLLVSPNVAVAYNHNLMSQGINTSGSDHELVFGRYKMVVNSHFPSNKMAICEPENLVVAFSANSDATELYVEDSNKENQIHIAGYTRIGVGISSPERVFFYNG